MTIEIALLIIGGILAYFFIGGVLYQPFYKRQRLNNHHSDAAFSAGLGATFWFIALPLFLGNSVGESLSDDYKGSSRDEKRRQKELAEANHKLELARIKRQEHEELLALTK